MEHQMNLHENTTLFNQSIRATAQRMNIADIYVEKDYWVMLALYLLFNSEIRNETVFKGGTALSKCFGLIKRFSEDIDLVMVRNEGEGTSIMEKKVKQPSRVIESELPEINIEGLTHKMGMFRKTVHQYNKQFNGDFGQVRDVIVLEASYLGRYEPYHNQEINSYIGEMMTEVGQLELAKEYGMVPFTVQVMHVNRTICEKIMSLVRFSYGDNPIQQLKDKIRHTYDIHQLLKEDEIKEFFISSDFETMLQNVAEDDKLSFKKDNEWLAIHPKEALLFADTDNVWSELKNTYSNDFGKLVYGQLPDEKDVLKTLLLVKERIQTINWNIQTDLDN